LESFRLALENNPGDQKYTLTETYIEAFVYAEKLDEALSAIQRYERSNLTPDKGRDYGLIRLRADIQLMKGQTERAALTYEEWISKGNVHSKIVRGSDFYKKLESLFKLTGHPANLNLVH
jgi:phage portal protein BeeE